MPPRRALTTEARRCLPVMPATIAQLTEEEIAKSVERIKNGTAKGRLAEDVLGDLRARLQ